MPACHSVLRRLATFQNKVRPHKQRVILGFAFGFLWKLLFYVESIGGCVGLHGAWMAAGGVHCILNRSRPAWIQRQHSFLFCYLGSAGWLIGPEASYVQSGKCSGLAFEFLAVLWWDRASTPLKLMVPAGHGLVAQPPGTHGRIWPTPETHMLRDPWAPGTDAGGPKGLRA